VGEDPGVRVTLDQLAEWIRAVLESEGVPSRIAWIEADVMAEADLHGVPSHGVRMLPNLIQALRLGQATRNPNLRVLRHHAAVMLLDCDHGPGRYTSARAMGHAVARAREYGIGFCLAIRTTHWGRAHAYALRAARNGMVGLCATNAIPNMTAWGSARPVLGNNPLAIGVPQPGAPLVLDMAMSQAAVGKVGTWLREGLRVPQGWGLDREGQPTDDPAKILESGRLLPCGGHKGAGLALMIELLTAGLSGGPLSHEIVETDRSGLDAGSTKLFLAIDPECFGEPGTLARRSGDLAAWLRAHAGVSIKLPGDRGREARRRNLEEGIPIHPAIASALTSLRPCPPWM
jgi:LDH2 family malate/lactate/ureidoglycolate dehydrogenase